MNQHCHFLILIIKQKLFIGPNTQLSNLLYKYFVAAAENQNSLGKEMQKFAFISGFDILLKLGKQP